MNSEKKIIAPFDVWKVFMYFEGSNLSCKIPKAMSISESCSKRCILQKGCYHHGGSNSGLCVVQALEVKEPGSSSSFFNAHSLTRYRRSQQWCDVSGIPGRKTVKPTWSYFNFSHFSINDLSINSDFLK